MAASDIPLVPVGDPEVQHNFDQVKLHWPDPPAAPAAPIVGGAGLTRTGDTLDVNVDGSTLEIASDTLRQKDGGTTLAKLAADARARAGHTGTQLAATISDFDTQVRTSRLDQMAAPTGAVAFGSQRITSVANPTAAQDAATKAYADGLLQGVKWKASVKAATTANIADVGIAPATIDGIALSTGDRFLVKNQTTTSQNGLYEVLAFGLAVRTEDADTGEELEGAAVLVEQGTTQANMMFIQTADAITLGATAITWVQFASLTDLVAGAGLTKTGNTVDVVAADGSITVNANDLTVGNVPVSKGGTGATNAADARTNLGVPAGVAQVAFSAYEGTTTTSVTGWQKVTCATEDYDTDGLYDNATNYRFSPPEGYYRLSATVYHFPIQTNMATGIYKNGTLWRVLQAQSGTVGADWGMPGGSCNVYCDGNDYFELWFYTSTGVAAPNGIQAGSAYTHFSGERI